MKNLRQRLLLFCLPLLLMACEEGLFGLPLEGQSDCLEITQESNNGLTIERIYENRRITELRFMHYGELVNYFAFSYGEDGRINESQLIIVENNTEIPQPPQRIFYHDNGKWSEVSTTYPNGNVTTNTAVYDNQGQIQKITSSTNKAGVISVNYTVTFTWEAGNNTVRTFTSPTNQVVSHYEFDPGQENRRQEEQEKLAFLTTGVEYNKNMYSQSVTTATTDTSYSETVSLYSYQFNEDGYPSHLTRNNTSDSGASTITETDFLYYCH